MESQLKEKKTLIERKKTAPSGETIQPQTDDEDALLKRKRRKAVDVQRSYGCPVPNCRKSYG